ncbi:MAG TPA: hypothetical protein VFI34_06420 [Candidatus Limnocylindrales bacterium]|nr:hypothetical protein [Candidatus Limnocylindrales bacterium]
MNAVPELDQILEPDEKLHVAARTSDAVLGVTDRRLVVAAPERLALAIPFHALRRIQFDIERNRPATLVIVPESPADEPQVLSIPAERYRETADALVMIGERLATAS